MDSHPTLCNPRNNPQQATRAWSSPPWDNSWTLGVLSRNTAAQVPQECRACPCSVLHSCRLHGLNSPYLHVRIPPLRCTRLLLGHPLGPDTPAAGPPFGRQWAWGGVGRGFWAPGGMNPWRLKTSFTVGRVQLEEARTGPWQAGTCFVSVYEGWVLSLLPKPDCKPFEDLR